MDERLTNLEVRVAYQDRIIDDLNQVVAQFAERVERLESTIAELRSLTTDDIGPAHEKPPHY